VKDIYRIGITRHVRSNSEVVEYNYLRIETWNSFI
jgi:hypothetical protein